MSLGFSPTASRPIAGESSPTITGAPLAITWTQTREIEIEYTNDRTLAAEYEPGVEE